MDKDNFKEWFNSRPDVIKNLIKSFPPARYQIKFGAPYSISCSGSVVTVIGYKESGDVVISLKAEDKLPRTIENQIIFCKRQNKTPEEIQHILKQDLTMTINPMWLQILN